MKVFICWSGGRSKAVAQALRDWLPTILENITLTYSPDIPKGARWFEAISQELSQAKAGLICLTPENLESPWVHFEAGALAKETNKIFTFLYNVQPTALLGPFAQFQSTEANQEDMRRLLASITELMGDEAPARQQWDPRFDQQWPLMEERLRKIESLSMVEILPSLERLFESKTYDEPLAECTDQRWRDRYDRARATLSELKRSNRLVREMAKPYVSDYYQELVNEVDGYCMDMGAFLLLERKFDGPNEHGKLEIESPILTPCERRRLQIKRLVGALLEPGGAPLLDDSRRYRKLLTIEDKKAQLIHPMERRIQEGIVPSEIIPHGATSSWEFDRIVYYLVQENRPDADLVHLIECVRAELEKVRARDHEGSLMPLHYAIRALDRDLRRQHPTAILSGEIKLLTDRVESYLQGNPSRDAEGHIRENLAGLRGALKL